MVVRASLSFHVSMKAAFLLLLLFWSPTTARTVPSDALWHLIKSWTGQTGNTSAYRSKVPPKAGWAAWNPSSTSFMYVPAESRSVSDNGAAPAYAHYSHYSNHASGFGQLRVRTNPSYSNKVQIQGAGFIEGYLTAPQIFDHWYNQRWWLSQKTNDTFKIMDWLMVHYTWLTQQLQEPANRDDPFWQAMELVVAQLEGMMDGYNARVSVDGEELAIEHIDIREWLTLNTMGDMDDLLEALFPDDPALGIKHLHLMEPAALQTRLATRGRCSVLIKITPDLSDLLVGHTTWWTYTSMTRIYKHYTFNLNGQQWKAKTSSMSSYPGMITSMDDFYILDSKLIVTETSNGILDPEVWKQVVPQAALSWQRMLAANWLSDNGKDWAHWVKQHNSGTYNNQYMVIDLKRFMPGEELQGGLLTVVEQMPGLVLAADKTQTLERGYWPSYNVPSFPEIYNKSGYPEFADKLRSKREYNGVVAGISYQLAPRAKISRRDQGQVWNLDHLKTYMRSNSWSTDPYSGGTSYGAICGRGDINPKDPKASGCNDAKVTSYKLAMRNAAEAVVGPTPGDGGALGPFSWQGQWAHVTHRGMPEVFDFKFELQQP